MVTWEPWHRLEYRRDEPGEDWPVLVYTERCQDNGWKLRVKGYTREEWFITYTRVCAVDYLERRDAKPGDYLVAVYRTGEISASKGLYLGSVRLRWPSVLAAPTPGTGRA